MTFLNYGVIVIVGDFLFHVKSDRVQVNHIAEVGLQLVAGVVNREIEFVEASVSPRID